jgi:hypothetical protein
MRVVPMPFCFKDFQETQGPYFDTTSYTWIRLNIFVPTLSTNFLLNT